MIKPLTHPPETPLFSVFQDDFRSCLHLLPPKKDSISFFLLSISFLHLSIQLFFLLYLGDRCTYRLVSCYHGYHCIYICIYMNIAQRRRGGKKEVFEHYKKKNVKVVDGHRTFNNLGFFLLISSFSSCCLLPFLQVFLLRAVSCFRGREGILPEKRYLFMLRPLKYSPLNEKSFFVVSN